MHKRTTNPSPINSHKKLSSKLLLAAITYPLTPAGNPSLRFKIHNQQLKQCWVILGSNLQNTAHIILHPWQSRSKKHKFTKFIQKNHKNDSTEFSTFITQQYKYNKQFIKPTPTLPMPKQKRHKFYTHGINTKNKSFFRLWLCSNLT